MYKKVSVTIATTLAIAAIMTVSWSAMQRSHAQSEFANTIMQVHNAERAAVNVPELTWSDSLAADAKGWAEHLATVGSLVHATGTGQGENLWSGTAGAYNTAEQVKSWADEKNNYNGGAITKWVKGDPVTGHYTQMVWRSTTQVGCATATGGGNDYLVCRYSPPGNYIGQTPY